MKDAEPIEGGVTSDPLVYCPDNSNTRKRRKIPKVKKEDIKEELIDIAKTVNAELSDEPEMSHTEMMVGQGDDYTKVHKFTLDGVKYPYAELRELRRVPTRIKEVGMVGSLKFREEAYLKSWYEIEEVIIPNPT